MELDIVCLTGPCVDFQQIYGLHKLFLKSRSAKMAMCYHYNCCYLYYILAGKPMIPAIIPTVKDGI